MIKKLTAVVLLLTFLFLCAGCAATEAQPADNSDNGVHSVTDSIGRVILNMDDPWKGTIKQKPLSTKTVKLYVNDEITNLGVVNSQKDVEVYFYDSDSSVAYMELGALADILVSSYGKYDQYSLKVGKNESGYTLVNGREDMVLFDTKQNVLLISNEDGFVASDKKEYMFDIVHLGDSGDNANLLKHYNMSYISGDAISIDLNVYGIHLAEYNGKCLVPVALFNDLIFCGTGFNLVFNSENMFVIASYTGLIVSGEPTEFGALYYMSEKKERPQPLIDFAYRELCLNLDVNYGLKEKHGITSFNSYFIRTGLREYLMSNDPDEYYTGLSMLTLCYLGDGHSVARVPTPYTGHPGKAMDPDLWDKRVINGYNNTMYNSYNYKIKRIEVTGNIAAPGYFENGDTAFVVFDAFVYDRDKDYYSITPQNNPNDTVELLLYADGQIRRENSPIKNVVIDISNNGGGMADAAACVASWFVKTGSFALDSTLTGCKSDTIYYFDANRNHVFNEDGDTLKGSYNLYCLISPVSFSCGNLIPAVFKASGDVTLLGKHSGGGACVVAMLSTADGCIFQASSSCRLSTVFNGSYYDVDTGVAPDVYIDRIDDMYDADFITKLIASLH